MGWTSPFSPYLKSEDTHLISGPLSSEDISWIGSLLSVGGLIGAIFFGSIAHKIGKKNTMFLLVIPHLFFWGLVYFATHAYHLYIARTLAGITGGGTLRTISLYITEMSENGIRGALGALYFVCLASGILLIYILGAYLNYFLVPIVVLVIPASFLISLMFLPDTPVSLLSRNKVEEAFKSLKFYRTCNDDGLVDSSVIEEFETMKMALQVKHEENLSVKDFSK